MHPVEVFKKGSNWDLRLDRDATGRSYTVKSYFDGSGDVMLGATYTPYIDVEVYDTGSQHIAIGILDQIDTGDAPDSFEGNNSADNYGKHYVLPTMPPQPTTAEEILWNTQNPPNESFFVNLNTPILGIGKYLDSEDRKLGGDITSLTSADYAKADDKHGAEKVVNGETVITNDEDGIPGGIWYGVCDGSIKVHNNYDRQTAYLKVWASDDGGTTFNTNDVVVVPVEAGFDGYKYIRFTDLGIQNELVPGMTKLFRFRISTDANMTPTGFLSDGEMEDHLVRFVV